MLRKQEQGVDVVDSTTYEGQTSVCVFFYLAPIAASFSCYIAFTM